ncbi:MAG TPA: hypothetical protein VFW47_08100 [Phenylobacterium sp.]|nr:hypothetical protein [Phenylobacterium sp.]
MRPGWTILALCLTLAAPAAAQPAPDAGEVHFANSGAASAQASFLRGLALLHDFEYPRAAAAFREAQAADPGFAMAYWGEAMTYNHPVWMEQDLVAARGALARLGPTPEARAAKARTARERDYLATVETLYGEGQKNARDFQYADAMAALHARYPDDVDATAFYALSLLGTSHQGRDFATYMKSAALLEEVYPTHLRHPGVLHYLIHSYDDPIHAPLGLRAANRYGAVAPDAPHALHMTSHIFVAMGMWDEVIAANRRAMEVLNGARARRNLPPQGCGHYPNWLMYGYLQEGRDADARATLAACRATAMAELGRATDDPDPDHSALGSYDEMRLMQAVETGRWDSSQDLTAPHGSPSAGLRAAYGRAITALRTGDLRGLQASSASLVAFQAAQAAANAAAGRTPDRVYDGSAAIIADQMSAAARLRGGDVDGGLAALRKTAEAEVAMPMEFGPPVVNLPTWELLGDELLRLRRAPEAIEAYRNALARAPGRTRSLQGLLKAQEMAGSTTGAAATRAELARYPR